MIRGTSFFDYLNALTAYLGTVGLLAVLVLIVFGSGLLLMWRYGPYALVWLYFFFAVLAAGGRGTLGYTPVMPGWVIVIGAGLRWFLLILLALLGISYVVCGKIRFRGVQLLFVLWALFAVFSAAVSGQTSIAFQRAIALSLLICSVFVIYRIVDSSDGMAGFMKTFLWLAILIAGVVVTACVLRPTLVFTGGRFRGFVIKMFIPPIFIQHSQLQVRA